MALADAGASSTSAIQCATIAASGSPKPRVVMAGVPRRKPDALSEYEPGMRIWLTARRGESYRTGRFSRASNNVPWRGKAQPEGTFEALDWIAVQEMLLSMGYSREVVEQVYKIRIKEISRIKQQNKGKDSVTDYAIPLYDEDKPFNAALKASGKPAPSRGPASE